MQIPKLLPVVCAVAFCASAIVAQAEDTPAQAACRAALMEKMNEWDVQQPQPAQPASPPVIVVTPSGATQVQPSQPANAPAMTSPPVTKAVVVQQPSKPANISYPGKELGLKPIKAPPLPVSAVKEAQLQALLERYKVNQITPEQYHTERAKILAEP
jgi:hypothetical protein